MFLSTTKGRSPKAPPLWVPKPDGGGGGDGWDATWPPTRRCTKAQAALQDGELERDQGHYKGWRSSQSSQWRSSVAVSLSWSCFHKALSCRRSARMMGVHPVEVLGTRSVPSILRLR